MGFRKPLYDVEEKGLDPQIPHNNLGSDGRLLPAKDNLNIPTAVSSPSKKEETDLDDDVKAEAVQKAKKTVAKTPSSANKATDKKTVDKQQDAIKELPDDPKTEKESSTKKKVTRARKTTPKAKAKKKTTKRKSSTTSSKAKTTRKKAAS